jgi:hypothetical protein
MTELQAYGLHPSSGVLRTGEQNVWGTVPLPFSADRGYTYPVRSLRKSQPVTVQLLLV